MADQIESSAVNHVLSALMVPWKCATTPGNYRDLCYMLHGAALASIANGNDDGDDFTTLSELARELEYAKPADIDAIIEKARSANVDD